MARGRVAQHIRILIPTATYLSDSFGTPHSNNYCEVIEIEQTKVHINIIGIVLTSECLAILEFLSTSSKMIDK